MLMDKGRSKINFLRVWMYDCGSAELVSVNQRNRVENEIKYKINLYVERKVSISPENTHHLSRIVHVEASSNDFDFL